MNDGTLHSLVLLLARRFAEGNPAKLRKMLVCSAG